MKKLLIALVVSASTANAQSPGAPAARSLRGGVEERMLQAEDARPTSDAGLFYCFAAE